jgi:TnpA family transposase
VPFALRHLLRFQFAPRIRDLYDMKLCVPGSVKDYSALTPMIGDTYSEKHIRRNWDEVLRLATSIRQGTVTASLMLRKRGSYPPGRMALLSPCAKLVASSVPCSSWTGCKTSNCAAACTLG